jgi:hypothetical protein
MALDDDCFSRIESQFDDAKNTELWELRRGDFLFGNGEDPDWDLQLDFAQGKWREHVRAYKRAADNLVSVVICGSQAYAPIDVYPILALYRHYIELALKELLLRACWFRGEDPPHDFEKRFGHRLKEPWEKARDMLRGGETDDPSIEWDLMTEYVTIAEQIQYDLGWYPWTRPNKESGRNVVQPLDEVINLVQLRLFMNRLGGALESVSNYVDWLTVPDSP